MNLRKRFRDWLGITQLQKDHNDLYTAYVEHFEDHHSPKLNTSASIEATGYAAYSSEQTGNVVIAEPKLLKVLRNDIEV